MTHIPSEQLHALARSVLVAWGMAEDAAETTARLLVETDLRAIDSHGVSMLPFYEQMHRNGTLNMRPTPRVVRETPATALIDADRGLGHPIASEAMRLACDKARATGLGAVGVRNSHHFGATGLYAEMAADQGLVGFVTSSTSVAGVIPTNGAQPLLGTNPIAFAAPAPTNGPFLLDMSTSTVAVNKVKVYALNDKPLPTGWVVDGQGRTVVDSAQALALCHAQKDGGLMALGGDTERGGHKGYGLAVMVQILSSALTGGSFSPVRNANATGPVPHNIGHFFLAIDPAAFRDEGEFERDVDEVLAVLKGSRPADAATPVQTAGEPERASRAERIVAGVPMPDSLLAQLRSIADNAGVPYTLAA
jgi:LDH2 family malate/lactate/ureidoglycolate dehydrogenase